MPPVIVIILGVLIIINFILCVVSDLLFTWLFITYDKSISPVEGPKELKIRPFGIIAPIWYPWCCWALVGIAVAYALLIPFSAYILYTLSKRKIRWTPDRHWFFAITVTCMFAGFTGIGVAIIFFGFQISGDLQEFGNTDADKGVGTLSAGIGSYLGVVSAILSLIIAGLSEYMALRGCAPKVRYAEPNSPPIMIGGRLFPAY